MKAEEYLRQVKKLDALVNNKSVELDQLYTLATRMNAPLNPDKVQTSGAQDPLGDTVTKIVDLRAEINALIDQYVDRKNAVIKVIEELPTASYTVLHKRYVQYMTWQDIATEMNYSTEWLKTLHKRALEELQIILNNTQ